jgi:hypothetical protein
MLTSEYLLLVFLLGLICVGLWVAQWAWHQQLLHYQTLQILSSLDSRRKQLSEAVYALQQMDIPSDILVMLFQALAEDIRQIIKLDPRREDLSEALQRAEKGARKQGQSEGAGSAAVATEQELMVAQRHIQRALRIFMELYQGEKISASQYQGARDDLRLLGLRIAVNSSLLMAQRAVDQEDGIKAMACFRRAESLLGMRGLPTDEKKEKLEYIKQERERLFSDRSRGLMLLTGNDG